MRGLSLVAASGGHSSLRCADLSLSWPLLLRSTGSRRAGSVVVAHGPSCSTACGFSPDQGSNPCPLHWQADSQPLHHQGSPGTLILDFLDFRMVRNKVLLFKPQSLWYFYYSSLNAVMLPGDRSCLGDSRRDQAEEPPHWAQHKLLTLKVLNK